MQIWTPSADPRDEGEFAVQLNNHRPDHPFAVIELSEDSRTALIITSIEEARRLARAAERAVQLLAIAATRQEGA